MYIRNEPSLLDLGTITCNSSTFILLWSKTDNFVRYLYSIDYGKVLDTLYAHDDAVSCIRLASDLLISGSWDSTVKIWKHSPTGNQSFQLRPFQFGFFLALLQASRKLQLVITSKTMP